MDNSEAAQAIDHILRFVDSELSLNMSVTWSGHPHDLTFHEEGRAGAGLAVLHLLLERWLSEIEYVLVAVHSIICMADEELASPLQKSSYNTWQNLSHVYP